VGLALLEGAGIEEVEVLHDDEVDKLSPSGAPEAALGFEEGAETGEVGGDGHLAARDGDGGANLGEELSDDLEGGPFVEGDVELIERIVLAEVLEEGGVVVPPEVLNLPDAGRAAGGGIAVEVGAELLEALGAEP
jgi:hypothetical protein